MRRPQIALVLVGVLVLVGGGGAALANKGKSAATTHAFRGGEGRHGPGDDLQAAATYLGTTTSDLLTQAQADAITANLQQRFTDLVNGVRPDHGFGGPGGPHGFDGHGPLAAVGGYLGITESALVTQLQAGKTLAQIANATSGKSAAGLIVALVADAKQRFGANVPSDLEQHIADLVNGVRPAFGPGDHDHGPFGPPPAGGSSA